MCLSLQAVAANTSAKTYSQLGPVGTRLVVAPETDSLLDAWKKRSKLGDDDGAADDDEMEVDDTPAPAPPPPPPPAVAASSASGAAAASADTEMKD